MATSTDIGISTEVMSRADYVMGVKDRHSTGMVSFPWFDKHVIFGAREIFQWTNGQGPQLSGDGVPHIGGALWQSREAIVAYYKADAASGYAEGEGEELPADLIRFVPTVGYFPTWEQAEAWLFGGEG